MRIIAVRARDSATIAARAAEVAQWAAAHEQPSVVCPPIATFMTDRSAAMKNMRNGLAITLDVDNADPREALRAVHGPGEPTVVTMTGSVWECPATHEPVPKIHLH